MCLQTAENRKHKHRSAKIFHKMLPSRLTRFLSRNTRNFTSSRITSSTENESKITKAKVDPLKIRDFFGVQQLFTVEDLFRARVHLGHTPTQLTPQMKPFVYGTRFNTSIIDLDETSLLLRQALNFMAHIAYKGGIILFLARQPQLVHMVEKTALESGEYAHCRRWKTTILTAHLIEFGTEVRHPDCMVFLHTKDGSKYDYHLAIRDAAKLNIPTVGIVDTDCDPNLISYPIPGNDDSLESQQLYLHLFKQAILLGKKKRKEDGLE